jgi:hypothetical protein
MDGHRSPIHPGAVRLRLIPVSISRSKGQIQTARMVLHRRLDRVDILQAIWAGLADCDEIVLAHWRVLFFPKHGMAFFFSYPFLLFLLRDTDGFVHAHILLPFKMV